MESSKGTLRKRATKSAQSEVSAKKPDQQDQNEPAESQFNDSPDQLKQIQAEFVEFNEAVKNQTPNKNSYYLTRIVLLRFQAFLYGSNFIRSFSNYIFYVSSFLMNKQELLS